MSYYYCKECVNGFFSKAIVPRCPECHSRKVGKENPFPLSNAQPMGSPEPSKGASLIDFHNWRGVNVCDESKKNLVHSYKMYLVARGFGTTHFDGEKG